jgi:hypothetical protein
MTYLMFLTVTGIWIVINDIFRNIKSVIDCDPNAGQGRNIKSVIDYDPNAGHGKKH